MYKSRYQATFWVVFRKINMIDITTMNEYYKYSKKITNTLLLVRKIKKLKVWKMPKKSGLRPAFIHTTLDFENSRLTSAFPSYDVLK